MATNPQLGADICNPDAIPPDGDYYVTVRPSNRSKQVRALLGPYSDLREALANEPRGRRMAIERASADAVFYIYGTARYVRGSAVKTVFGR